jgi:hypothetical protein
MASRPGSASKLPQDGHTAIFRPMADGGERTGCAGRGEGFFTGREKMIKGAGRKPAVIPAENPAKKR